VVVDNFATGVMERLGLTAEAFHAVKPDLIVATISGYGKTGPLARYMGYGPSIPPLSGLTSVTGYADGLPREIGISYGDPNGGIHTAFAIVAALLARQHYGGGQAIELSLWEAMLCVSQESWIGHVLGSGYRPMGNRDPRWAPHNLYRCAGEDAWVAIACPSEAQWRALCAAMEQPALAEDTRFRDLPARKQNEDLLDARIAEWVAPQERWAVTRRLQAVGVSAFPSLSSQDLLEDEHLNARGYFTRLPHPEVGARAHTGIPWRFAHRPNGVCSAAPLLGAHTEEVLGKLLGMDRREMEALRQVGVLE
jgi:crotonobetainyl-CoA:carnitine CoA-transferase CaiB-like acyl-CoA transferase